MNQRYERKFLLPEVSQTHLETLIKLHPKLFREIYHKRQIHNIYFDSTNLESYYDNVEGSTNRKKIRVRWYSDSRRNEKEPNNPKIEIKTKDGLLGTKQAFLSKNFSFTSRIPNLSSLLMSSSKSIEEINFLFLQPVLYNTYTRRYFESFDGKFRFTIDTGINFHKVVLHKISKNYAAKLENTVLELKYDKRYDQEANKITSFLPYRLTKSSKYVMGVQSLYSI